MEGRKSKVNWSKRSKTRKGNTKVVQLVGTKMASKKITTVGYNTKSGKRKMVITETIKVVKR